MIELILVQQFHIAHVAYYTYWTGSESAHGNGQHSEVGCWTFRLSLLDYWDPAVAELLLDSRD